MQTGIVNREMINAKEAKESDVDMREIFDIRDIQRIEYNILVYLTEFFDANNITYMLCGGTLLGAIRHRGFIPWDDDIDIFVPREDYEKFKTLVAEGYFISDVYEVGIPGKLGYRYPFIKVFDKRTIAQEGNARIETRIWIDVFPLDHFPDNEFEHRRVLNKIKRRLYLFNAPVVLRYTSNSVLKKWVCLLLTTLHHLIGTERLAGYIDQQARKMDQKYKRSGYRGDGAWPNGLKDSFDTTWLFPTVAHRFETREFQIPNGYDAYLKQFYGDYMTPPPPEQRMLQHNLRAWWLPEEDWNDVFEDGWMS